MSQRNSQSGSSRTLRRKSPSKAAINTFRRQVLAWGQRCGRDFPWRRAQASNYERVISEVLLQRTRAEVVGSIFQQFLRCYPSWRALAQANANRLREFLRPLGLWRRRALSMKKLSRVVTQGRSRFPKTREELEKLPAVGQYVASAVLLFCHGEPEPLVDTNMARVVERYFGPRALADIRYDPYLQRLTRDIVRSRTPALVNWAILDLGALICVPRDPRCEKCPLRGGCKDLAHKDRKRRTSLAGKVCRNRISLR